MIYDSIVIGSGPAGISASLYLKRSGLNILVLTTNDSALLKAELVENYYGTGAISGIDLYNEGINQVKKLRIEIKEEQVFSAGMIPLPNNQVGFSVKTDKETYCTKTIVLATGTKRSIPNVANIKNYVDKNISFCAICDGFFYRKKDVYVLGYGKYALAEAEELKKIANSVTILTNGHTPEFNQVEDIKVITTPIKKFSGETKLEHIEFIDDNQIDVPGLFVAWGVAGGYDFARKIGIQVENNKIVVNKKMETNVKGFYACGDVIGAPYQVSTAVYEGSIAGLSISDMLKHK